jgi:malate/lactate dehydrogenase
MDSDKKYISELIDKNRAWEPLDEDAVKLTGTPLDIKTRCNQVNILALGDVGSTLLLGMKLLAGDTVETIGIYDLSEAVLRRFEREMNQIQFPDGRQLPHVKLLCEEDLFDCNMFVFCASMGVPPVGAEGEKIDVRMAQLEANSRLVKQYARGAVKAGYKGIFAVVSDPVDPLCKAALSEGLMEHQVQGYGLGVMNARAAYYAREREELASYLSEGRAFGPHGEDLVIANSIENYDHKLSRKLTELAVKSNLETRADGFKPYIAPAISSGAISLIETLRGSWNYSSVYLGREGDGAFLGCRNKRIADGIIIENLPLHRELFERIQHSYENLRSMG